MIISLQQSRRLRRLRKKTRLCAAKSYMMDYVVVGREGLKIFCFTFFFFSASTKEVWKWTNLNDPSRRHGAEASCPWLRLDRRDDLLGGGMLRRQRPQRPLHRLRSRNKWPATADCCRFSRCHLDCFHHWQRQFLRHHLHRLHQCHWQLHRRHRFR